MEEAKTYKLTLSGVVQGVGMRFFVSRTSKRMGINGYVKNMYNGNVECVAQAKEEVINEFIKYIKRNSPGVIDNVVKEELFDNQIFSKFQVKLF